MNTPFPHQPNPPRASLAPQVSDKTSLLAGTPLSIVGLLLWKSLTGDELSDVYAVGLGATFAAVAGYAGHVVKVLIDRAINRS
jgi:hypothetical protein